MVRAGVVPGLTAVGKRIRLRPRNLQKLVFLLREHDTVAHDPCQILCSRVMKAVLIRGVEPVWRDKIGVRTSNLFCLPVHHLRKVFGASANMLRNRHCRIIMRLKHEGIKQIFQIKKLPLPHPQLHLRLRRCFGTHPDLIRQIPVLECQDTGQYLRCAGHGHGLGSVFGK